MVSPACHLLWFLQSMWQSVSSVTPMPFYPFFFCRIVVCWFVCSGGFYILRITEPHYVLTSGTLVAHSSISTASRPLFWGLCKKLTDPRCRAAATLRPHGCRLSCPCRAASPARTRSGSGRCVRRPFGSETWSCSGTARSGTWTPFKLEITGGERRAPFNIIIIILKTHDNKTCTRILRKSSLGKRQII